MTNKSLGPFTMNQGSHTIYLDSPGITAALAGADFSVNNFV